MIEQCNDKVYIRPSPYELIGCDIIKMDEKEARQLAMELVSHFARLDRAKPHASE